MKLRFTGLLIACLLYTGLVHAATMEDLQKQALQKCFEDREKRTPQERLACYDNVLSRQTDTAPVAPPILPTTAATSAPVAEAAVTRALTSNLTNSRLRRLWQAVDANPALLDNARKDVLSTPESSAEASYNFFRQYKQNYLLPWTMTRPPNNAPSSPNSQNQVTADYPNEVAELKFQLSLKSRLPFTQDASRHAWWLAYTQQSQWQFYDSEHSRPFRDSNYEPELIYSYDLSQTNTADWLMTPQFINFGVVHRSNGQSLPRSRSWNRIYVQLGLEQAIGPGNLALLIRPWWRIPEKAERDDNPDIGHYQGYGDLELRYWTGRQVYSLVARKRALQFDVALPIWRTLNLHLQYFTGYGESLIDYNQRHQTFGLGISLPYGM
ncbi:MAG: putative phospholipase [Rhodocyclales bacterium]|nr:putative phospholipase [Rhodocyclales bacterium]